MQEPIGAADCPSVALAPRLNRHTGAAAVHLTRSPRIERCSTLPKDSRRTHNLKSGIDDSEDQSCPR